MFCFLLFWAPSFIQEYIFFLIFQECKHFVKQKRIASFFARNFTFLYKHIKVYLFFNLLIKGKKKFSSAYVFDRTHALYFLHKYQNMSIISSLSFLYSRGTGQYLISRSPNFLQFFRMVSLCTFVRVVL